MAIRFMLPAKKGVIINISSIAGRQGVPNASAYAISKSALNGLARCIAAEYASSNIRCVGVSPGFMQVPNIQGISSEDLEEIRGHIPQKRTGTPAEIASAVAFLASDECTYINGTDLLSELNSVAGNLN
jgi:NAD(P)-dependent dehydrogenase (short-subunit alcohol dehydrogenase family)